METEEKEEEKKTEKKEEKPAEIEEIKEIAETQEKTEGDKVSIDFKRRLSTLCLGTYTALYLHILCIVYLIFVYFN